MKERSSWRFGSKVVTVTKAMDRVEGPSDTKDSERLLLGDLANYICKNMEQ